jgi:hypothetical protein
VLLKKKFTQKQLIAFHTADHTFGKFEIDRLPWRSKLPQTPRFCALQALVHGMACYQRRVALRLLLCRTGSKSRVPEIFCKQCARTLGAG